MPLKTHFLAVLLALTISVPGHCESGVRLIPGNISGMDITPLGGHWQVPDEIAWCSNTDLICIANDSKGNCRLVAVNVDTGKMKFLSVPSRMLTLLLGTKPQQNHGYQCKVSRDGRQILVWSYLAMSQKSGRVSRPLGSTFLLSADGRQIHRLHLETFNRKYGPKYRSLPRLTWSGDSRHWMEVCYPTSVLHDGHRRSPKFFTITGLEKPFDTGNWLGMEGFAGGSLQWTYGDIFVLPRPMLPDHKAGEPLPLYLFNARKRTDYQSSLIEPDEVEALVAQSTQVDTAYPSDFYISRDAKKVAWVVVRSHMTGNVSHDRYEVYVSKTGSKYAKLVMTCSNINNLAWSPNGKQIAVLGDPVGDNTFPMRMMVTAANPQ